MLRIEGLSKTYANGVHALANLNLEVKPGLFGLLGPNGAGKSSLMRTIATLQPCDSGAIQFGAIDVLTQPEEIRKTLGYLPQDFEVYPQFSALTMLNHFAALKGIAKRGERRDAVQGLLAMVNLWDVRHRKLGTYSGGMRQRFGVAQALLGNPRLVIVDEPAAGLDPEERQRMLNFLSEIGEHVVVILSTHLVEDVADLCRSMAILMNGSIVAGGEPERLIASLHGRIWSAVLDRSQIKSYREQWDVLSARLSAGRIALRIQSETSPGPAFRRVEANLSDVYFSVLNQNRRQDMARQG